MFSVAWIMLFIKPRFRAGAAVAQPIKAAQMHGKEKWVDGALMLSRNTVGFNVPK